MYVGGPTIFYNDFSLTRINLALHTFLLNLFLSIWEKALCMKHGKACFDKKDLLYWVACQL